MAKSDLTITVDVTVLKDLLTAMERIAERITAIEDRLEKVEAVAHEQITDDTLVKRIDPDLLEKYRKMIEEAKRKGVPRPWREVFEPFMPRPARPIHPLDPQKQIDEDFHDPWHPRRPIRHEFDPMRRPIRHEFDPMRRPVRFDKPPRKYC